MADFKVLINETITLDGVNRSTQHEKVYAGVTSLDNRVLSLGSGSQVSIADFSNKASAGTFHSSSFQYGRFTNTGNKNISLIVSSSSETSFFNIQPGKHFILSDTIVTGSAINASGSYSYDQIRSIKAEPISGSSTLEFVIAN